MEEENQQQVSEVPIEDSNNIKIADEVVAIVAGIAATEVPGVAGMAGGIVGGITERLGLKNLQKGVKVEVGNRETALDLYIVVHYGARIPEVAQRVQEEVRKAIVNMTGLRVVEVNIHVQGVAFDERKEEAAQAR